MQIYHGRALVPGVAIAVAAKIQETYGLPQISPERQRLMGEYLRRAGLDQPEPEQVVLLAVQVPSGFLATPFPGLDIAGAAAGLDQEILPIPSVPTVVGLGDELLSMTEEGEIIIVDGDRGRVYVSPDAQTLARYQGPARRARRFFIEPVHVEARRRSTGIVVPVFTWGRDANDVQTALDLGADGVLIPALEAWEDDFLTSSEQLLWLRDLMDILGGKTLLVEAPLERIALSALVRAAAWGPVSLVLPFADAEEARAEMDALEPDMEEQDIAYGRVGLEACLEETDLPTPAQAASIDGVVVSGLEAPFGQLRASGYAVTLRVEEDKMPDEAHIAHAMDAGTSRLLVAGSQIQSFKEAVRRS